MSQPVTTAPVILVNAKALSKRGRYGIMFLMLLLSSMFLGLGVLFLHGGWFIITEVWQNKTDGVILYYAVPICLGLGGAMIWLGFAPLSSKLSGQQDLERFAVDPKTFAVDLVERKLFGSSVSITLPEQSMAAAEFAVDYPNTEGAPQDSLLLELSIHAVDGRVWTYRFGEDQPGRDAFRRAEKRLGALGFPRMRRVDRRVDGPFRATEAAESSGKPVRLTTGDWVKWFGLFVLWVVLPVILAAASSARVNGPLAVVVVLLILLGLLGVLCTVGRLVLLGGREIFEANPHTRTLTIGTYTALGTKPLRSIPFDHLAKIELERSDQGVDDNGNSIVHFRPKLTLRGSAGALTETITLEWGAHLITARQKARQIATVARVPFHHDASGIVAPFWTDAAPSQTA